MEPSWCGTLRNIADHCQFRHDDQLFPADLSFLLTRRLFRSLAFVQTSHRPLLILPGWEVAGKKGGKFKIGRGRNGHAMRGGIGS